MITFMKILGREKRKESERESELERKDQKLKIIPGVLDLLLE